MIVLKKAYSNRVEKNILPGESEVFFTLDLSDNITFDWKVKIIGDGKSCSLKVSSLYYDDTVDSTRYSILGYYFDCDIDVYEDPFGYCKFEIHNNELFDLKCYVILNSF
jgi:hypothetical protein